MCNYTYIHIHMCDVHMHDHEHRYYIVAKILAWGLVFDIDVHCAQSMKVE